MNSPATPVPRLVAIDRRQLLLRTVDVEKLVEDGHSVRSIWELVGRLDLRLYQAQIAAVEGRAGREHTDPQLLISLWLYAYSRGISSARELARQCEYEPGCQWLCGLQTVSHRTLSGFRSDNKTALDDLFTQVLGMLSAEGLITLERVTLDGTKIKANAGGNTFRGREKIAEHLAAAREQVHVLRNGGGGTVPSYNVQLVTDTQHGLVVNVEATTDAIDYRQLDPALERCEQKLGRAPRQIVADGDYTNHASVQAAATRGVDFYGSWQDSWKPTERDAQGRSAAFLSSAFPYDATQDVFRCPAGGTLRHRAVLNRGHGVRTRVYRAPKEACRTCALREQCAPPGARPAWRRSVTRIEEPSATTAFKAKRKTEEGRQIYARRSQIAEFAHAWIKERCGLRQFRCRGRLKATMEATWACLTYNLMRWFGLQRALQAQTAAIA